MFNLPWLKSEPKPLALPEIHDWKLVSKTYAPARPGARVDGLDPKVAEKVLLGVTTILWECQNTGELRTEEMLGSDESQLEELMQKINVFGPQYVRDSEGNTYELRRWAPPAQNPLDLPMR